MKRSQKKTEMGALEGLPDYVRARVDQRRQDVSSQRMITAIGRVAVNLSAEECDDLAQRLQQGGRATRLPEGCILSRQSRALFNLLVRRKGKAPFLTIAHLLWPKEYEDKCWAELDPRSPEYRRLLERIRKALGRLGEQLADGKARYQPHFSRDQGIVTLEKV